MPLKVIMLSTDRGIFSETSAVRARMLDYARFFDELHIIVFAKEAVAKGRLQIAKNAFVYPTESMSRFLYVRDAVAIGRKILSEAHDAQWIVSAQDPFETGLAGYRMAKAGKAKLHIQVHTDFLSPYFAAGSLLNRFRVLIARKLLPKADGIRVVSERVKDSLVREMQLKADTIKVVPIFVDMKQIAGGPVVPSLKEHYPQFNFVVLMASRLAQEKDIPVAFRALSRLVVKYPGTGLVIVGSGPLEGDLKTQVRKLDLDRSVVFLPWQADLVSYYKTADLFLSTSRYEGFGMSMLEAVSAGMPVVATDAGIAPELLSTGTRSYTCPVGDASCIEKKVSWFIEDNALREQAVRELWENGTRLNFADKAEYLEAYRSDLERLLQA